MTLLPSCSLYIHWPFCQSKCPYCDFNSHVRDQVHEDQWQKAFLQELAFVGQQMGRRSLRSVFFGGGTPSLMPPLIVEKILDALDNYFEVPKNMEVTLEGNPTSIEATRYQAFKRAGINRASIGIQSLRPETLKFLGRQHTIDEAKKALEIAAQTFDRVSFDLIYAVPGQTLSGWKKELQQALSFAKGHLSLYQLTIEPGTAFYQQYHRGDFTLPDDEHAARLYEVTNEIMAVHGYRAYEISNYAVPGHECQHNLGYWQYQDYACLGPGSHGRSSLDTPDTGLIKYEIKNYRAPETWLAKVAELGHGQEILQPLSKHDQMIEHVLMNLRLFDGINKQDFLTMHGVRLETILNMAIVDDLQQEGLIDNTQTHLRVTPQGMLMLNSILKKICI